MLYFGYLLEPVIEIRRTRPFFSQKFFVCVEIIFFRLRKCNFFATKKTNALLMFKPCTIKEEDEHQK